MARWKRAHDVLENPLARPGWLGALLLGLPEPVLRAATYGVLLLELLYAPLSLSRRLRPVLWVSLVSMHVGILWLVDFADLTLGMLLVHAYTFDPAWLAPPSHNPQVGSSLQSSIPVPCLPYSRTIVKFWSASSSRAS